MATTQQGSTASLQITGGSAAATLGLAAGATVAGTDGVIDVDGTSTTVNDIAGSGTTAVTLSSGTGGTLQVLLEGGLTAGSITAQNVSVGNGSLSAVVDAINAVGRRRDGERPPGGSQPVRPGADAPTAPAPRPPRRLTREPSPRRVSGTLTTTTASQNAVISIGGTGGYQVESASNQVTGLLPGVTVNLAQASSSPVTITVSPDGTQLATTVQALVTAANQVLSTISSDTAYNASTKTAGPLNGATALNSLAQQLLTAVGTAVGTSAAGSDGTVGESAGLAITAQGTITFNQTAFEAAYAKNPTAVQAMFTEGGTFAPASPSLAVRRPWPGPATTRRQVRTPSACPSPRRRPSTPVRPYGPRRRLLSRRPRPTRSQAGRRRPRTRPPAGESITDVISGLNSALASAGIGASAALVGSAGAYQVQLVTAAYGSAATFSVSASGADQLGLTSTGSTYTGVDVAGTIDGVAATGFGQDLSLVVQPATPPPASSSPSARPASRPRRRSAPFTYAPGFAQGLAHLAKTSSLAPSGLVPETIAGLQGTLQEVNSEIAMQQQLVATQQAALTQEFTNLEATLVPAAGHELVPQRGESAPRPRRLRLPT